MTACYPCDHNTWITEIIGDFIIVFRCVPTNYLGINQPENCLEYLALSAIYPLSRARVGDLHLKTLVQLHPQPLHQSGGPLLTVEVIITTSET